MFKRLFIGLLILSALFSDGVANLPVNLYNFCLSSQSKPDVYGFISMPAGQSSDFEAVLECNRDYNISGYAANPQGFVLTAESFSRIVVETGVEAPVNMDFPALSTACSDMVRNEAFVLTDSTVLKKSGLSPPFIQA